MAYDVNHAVEHAEVAGWALAVLDPGDAQTFEEHLRSCDQCQAVVAEFTPVARALGKAAPAAEPPDDLETRTVAAVQYAAVEASRPKRAPKRDKASRWWHLHWNTRLLPVVSAVAGAAIAAAVFLGLQVSAPTAAPVAATISLQPVAGQTATGHATARQETGGWSIQLTVQHLPALKPGQFYECWYAGPGNRPGHLQLITAGTFIGGDGTVNMWSAADPARFTIMQITIEQPGDASQHGQVILQGTAHPA